MESAKTKLVAYQETYRNYYEVDAALSDEEAVEQIRDDISIGKENGPETCVGSDCYVVPDPETLSEGDLIFWVPVTYTCHGRIPVILPENSSREEIFRKAAQILPQIDSGLLQQDGNYKRGSEQIDKEGVICD